MTVDRTDAAQFVALQHLPETQPRTTTPLCLVAPRTDESEAKHTQTAKQVVSSCINTSTLNTFPQRQNAQKIARVRLAGNNYEQHQQQVRCSAAEAANCIIINKITLL